MTTRSPGPRPWELGPLVCVWEVTRACNVRCLHCGSSAGEPRAHELCTAEAGRVIDDLAGLGCNTVALSGGEPLLRQDWPELVQRIHARGMRAELMTNGVLVSEQLQAVVDAGFASVSVSVDGPAEVHDALRGGSGNLHRALEAARQLAAHGVRVGGVTQVGRKNLAHLDDIHALLMANGFQGWLIQLTLPYGRARARAAELSLGPRELPELEAVILRQRRKSPLFIQVADTIGYMSRQEPELRAGRCGASVWGGCQAGLSVLGLTSDGTVRGCLSMPPDLDEDNIRVRRLADIWSDPQSFAYNRCFDENALSGECARCEFGPRCRAGCTTVACLSSGNTYDNPYCLRRV